jgi:kinesin family protein 20
MGLMSDAQDMTRPHHASKPPLIYSFDKVFAPPTSQSSFFTTTTLPLVERLLHGENGLMFAYGVSNSGKSYTISGGASHEAEERGLLPRSIDVVFNSIRGMETDAKVRRIHRGETVIDQEMRCHALADVEFTHEEDHLPLFDHLSPGLEARTQEGNCATQARFGPS